MRDPDLVVRAQRAASELERAWDRWRTMHGLGTSPLPPVSSYVGYSLHEPWGQPRVVFGIEAGEAEQLAALLDRHDCAGPVYASVASMARSGDTADARAADADRHRGAGRVRVPTQAQPGAAQRESPPEPAPPDVPPAGPPEPPAWRDDGARDDGLRDDGAEDEEEPEPGPAGTEAREPAAAHQVPAPGEGQGPEGEHPAPAGLAAFRPQHEPVARGDEGTEPGPVPDEGGPAAEPGQATAGFTRASRVPRGHVLPRQKRASGAARGVGGKQDGRGRSGLEASAAELAGWTAVELPGQASHQRLTVH